MRLTIIILLALILAVTAEDAYTACKCVRRRLHHKTCFHYVRHAIPVCAPGADWKACEALCCAKCLMYGDYWPVCRSGLLRKLCRARAEADGMNSGGLGPGMDEDMDIMPTEQPDIDPSGEPDETPEEIESTPVSDDDDESSEEKPKGWPTGEGPSGIELTPTPSMPKEDKPTVSDDKSTTGTTEPPFDATNEGELDLTPSNDGRPFAPAACECMSRGIGCNAVLAAASGVCKPGIYATRQGGDCKFACCRICTVNMYATFCDDAPIIEACGL